MHFKVLQVTAMFLYKKINPKQGFTNNYFAFTCQSTNTQSPHTEVTVCLAQIMGQQQNTLTHQGIGIRVMILPIVMHKNKNLASVKKQKSY